MPDRVVARLRCVVAVTSVALASVALATAVRAEDTAPVVLPSLEELFARAAAQSPEIAAAKLGRDASRSGLLAAKLQRLPVPAATLEAGQGRAAANVSVFGPLYDFGQGIRGVRLARHRLEASDLRIAQAGYDVSLRVLELVQTYLVNTRRAEAQRRGIVLLNDLAGMAERRMEAGVATLSEESLVRGRIAQAQSELQASEAQATSARLQLERLVGAPVALDRLVLAEPNNLLLADLLLRANAQALPVEIAAADAKVSEADAHLAQSQGMPVFGVAAERNDYSLVGGRVEYRVVGRISIAPGAGLSSFARARAMAQAAASARLAVGTAQRNVAIGIASEYTQLTANRARLPEAQQALQSTRDVVESYRRLFVGGRRSWLDLLNSARELTFAEISVSDLETVIPIASVRLRLLAGERLWDGG